MELEMEELKTELQWCIENGTYGPRTGVALQWALETVIALACVGKASNPKPLLAKDAEANEQGAYLLNIRKRKNRAHIWVDGDTACRMWSTGGLIQSLNGWTVSADREGREICQICECQYATQEVK